MYNRYAWALIGPRQGTLPRLVSIGARMSARCHDFLLIALFTTGEYIMKQVALVCLSCVDEAAVLEAGVGTRGYMPSAALPRATLTASR